MSDVKQVTLAEAQEIIRTDANPVILAVGAPWCVDCRRAQPFYMAFAKEFAGKITFLAANCEQEPALREVFNVKRIPTMMIFKNQQEVDRIVEVQTPAELRAFVQKAL